MSSGFHLVRINWSFTLNAIESLISRIIFIFSFLMVLCVIHKKLYFNLQNGYLESSLKHRFLSSLSSQTLEILIQELWDGVENVHS